MKGHFKIYFFLRQNNASVVCPVIDILDDETFQYTKSFSLHWGAFNWALHFRWFTLGSRLIQQVRDKNICRLNE